MKRSLTLVAAPSLLLTLAALALAGCSANKVTAPLNTLSNAQSNEAAIEVGMMVYAGTTPDVVPANVVANGGSLRGRGATPAAAETTVTSGNVTWTLALRWFDAGSNEQPYYDPATTVRLQANSHGNGTVIGPEATATLHSAGAMDLMGVNEAATQVTTNATRNDTLSWTASNPSGSVTSLTRSTGTLADVVEAKPVDQNYPASGTGTWDVDVNRQVQAAAGSVSDHFVAHVVVTFNGTHLVPLVVNGSHHFLLDLDTGAVTQVQG